MTLDAIIAQCSPLGDKVILTTVSEDDLQDQLPSGLYIPDQSVDLHQRHMQGEVVAVGPDVQEPALFPGLRVMLRRYSQSFIGDEGKYWVVREPDILAVLNV